MNAGVRRLGVITRVRLYSISFNLSSAVPDSVTKEKREKEMEGKRGETC